MGCARGLLTLNVLANAEIQHSHCYCSSIVLPLPHCQYLLSHLYYRMQVNYCLPPLPFFMTMTHFPPTQCLFTTTTHLFTTTTHFHHCCPTTTHVLPPPQVFALSVSTFIIFLYIYFFTNNVFRY